MSSPIGGRSEGNPGQVRRVVRGGPGTGSFYESSCQWTIARGQRQELRSGNSHFPVAMGHDLAYIVMSMPTNLRGIDDVGSARIATGHELCGHAAARLPEGRRTG